MKTKDFLLASACDQIILPESGMLMMPGLRAEISFYKNLFDMLGVQPEMLRVGEFKSAAEPFSRNEMSPAFREEMESILDDYYRQIIEMVSESRKLTQDQVKALIDHGLYSAEDAKQKGLIDHVAYEDHLETLIKGDRKDGGNQVRQRLWKKEDRHGFQRLRGNGEVDESDHGRGAWVEKILETKARCHLRGGANHVRREPIGSVRRKLDGFDDDDQGDPTGSR